MTSDSIMKCIFNIEHSSAILLPGVIVFPVFAFVIANHLAQKKNFKKYLMRLLPFAVLTYLIDCHYLGTVALNPLFTFILSVLLIWGLEKADTLKNKDKENVAKLVLVLGIGTLSFMVEFGLPGVLLLPAFYWFVKTRSTLIGMATLGLMAAIAPISVSYILFAVMVGLFLLVLKPTDDKHFATFKKGGWFFYAYYPLHKWIVLYYMVMSLS